ncbi:MAG: 23S rRNA (uracil(1939)-C(5))-methyltransferase RlmD [Gammaproteobacteria bacterium]|nr:23S rRNA (uracil(1939)-C(5))-methyltransferase RlmD [Gammaproteobacteria bacterium]
MARKNQRLPKDPVRATIDTQAHDGRGVARVDGKTVFVEGALAGEDVSFTYLNSKKNYDEAVVQEIFSPAAERVTPKCAAYGVCGGCSLMHLEHGAQIRFKQHDMLEKLKRMGKSEPLEVLAPLVSELWGYRRKARLGAKFVAKKGRVLVGFREKRAPFLAEMERCEVLHPSVGQHLQDLSELIGSFSQPDTIPQIEVAIGDEVKGLVFRHLQPLAPGDYQKLQAFGVQHDFQIYLQPKGPDSITALYPETPRPLSYRLPDFDVTLQFEPSDFTQVNTGINRQMVARAIDLLDVQPGETVLDLFCGLGNFSLPLARKATRVVAVEGERGLVERARANAERNGLQNVEFHVADLFADFTQAPWMQAVDKLLLDPPRSGAIEVSRLLNKFKPKRIVYVSCDPATLARDVEEIVHNQGYRLLKAGIMDMFPHTGHVESIAVFEQS